MLVVVVSFVPQIFVNIPRHGYLTYDILAICETTQIKEASSIITTCQF